MGNRNVTNEYIRLYQEPPFMENTICNELKAQDFLIHIGTFTNVENLHGKPSKIARNDNFVCEKMVRKSIFSLHFLSRQRKR